MDFTYSYGNKQTGSQGLSICTLFVWNALFFHCTLSLHGPDLHSVCSLFALCTLFSLYSFTPRTGFALCLLIICSLHSFFIVLFHSTDRICTLFAHYLLFALFFHCTLSLHGPDLHSVCSLFALCTLFSLYSFTLRTGFELLFAHYLLFAFFFHCTLSLHGPDLHSVCSLFALCTLFSLYSFTPRTGFALCLLIICSLHSFFIVLFHSTDQICTLFAHYLLFALFFHCTISLHGPDLHSVCSLFALCTLFYTLLWNDDRKSITRNKN